MYIIVLKDNFIVSVNVKMNIQQYFIPVDSLTL